MVPTYSLNEVSGFSSEVGGKKKTGMENLVYRSLSILSTERRLGVVNTHVGQSILTIRSLF